MTSTATHKGRGPAAPTTERGLLWLKLLTVALAGWSAMIWIQRIRNIFGNNAGESLIPPVLHLAIAAAAVVAVFVAPRATKLLAALAFGLWSVVWWVISQAIAIPKPVPPWVAAEQAVAFKVVHVALGVVAIVLGALLAWQAWRLRSADTASA